MRGKSPFFEGWSWFKFNNLGLEIGENLKFYTSVGKGLKLKVRKFWELPGEKVVGRGGKGILNGVKSRPINSHFIVPDQIYVNKQMKQPEFPQHLNQQATLYPSL